MAKYKIISPFVEKSTGNRFEQGVYERDSEPKGLIAAGCLEPLKAGEAEETAATDKKKAGK